MASPLGGGLMLLGAYYQRQAEEDADAVSAEDLREQAREKLREGEFNAKQTLIVGERVRSSQQAGLAKAGVVLSGSALEVMHETILTAEANATEIRRAAKESASRLNKQAEALGTGTSDFGTALTVIGAFV